MNVHVRHGYRRGGNTVSVIDAAGQDDLLIMFNQSAVANALRLAPKAPVLNGQRVLQNRDYLRGRDIGTVYVDDANAYKDDALLRLLSQLEFCFTQTVILIYVNNVKEKYGQGEE
ncbi:hypothetical protein [Acinetobacter sp.]|uniref:hypothetical protein n=1 Tax=Acinetobacter sp. TaxID=472 RepID=UPI003D05E38A